MMRQMREATKPIMLFTALAFASLMVFQWGMDITGQSGGGVGEIGSVNGDGVMYDAYMAAYRQLYDQVQRSQEELISSQRNKEIEDAAFDEIVTSLLIRQELRRRGITVSDQEINDEAQFRPPDYMIADFMVDGAFDFAMYQSWLGSLIPAQMAQLEAEYRRLIPRRKLLRQVSTGIYLSDAALWEQWKDQNEQVSIRYVPMDPASRYAAQEFTISDDDIEAYYQANQEEFAIPARASIKVVVLDKTPTPADTVASEERAGELRQEILDGADFAEVAARESRDAATASAGGELGVFAKAFMTPKFDSVVFEAPVGEVVGPVKTPYGYHIIEVMERWGADSVQARHVLIPIARTDDSEIELLMLADSIEDLGEAMALAEAAAAAGVEIMTIDLTRTFPFVVGAGQVSEGADWLFEEASPGDVSPVFETPTAFYAMELISSEQEGFLPLDDASAAIESTLLFEKQMARSREEALTVTDRVSGGEALSNIAADLELEVRTAGPFSRNDFVPGVGRQNAAIGAAFGTPLGEVSGVVSTPANTFVIEVTSRTAADSTAWLGQALLQRESVVTMVRQQRLQEWIVALRAAATIVDRRDIVLAPQDEDALGFPRVF